MKITFFIGSISGGGAERMICNLANFLSAKGHDVTVLTMSDVNDTYQLEKSVSRVYLLKTDERRNIIFNYLLRFWRLGKYMKSQDCDCYIVMLPITTSMMLLQRKKTQSPIIASERNSPESAGRLSQLIQKALARRADVWVFQTEQAMEWYGNRAREKRVIPNAINPEFIRPLYEGEKSKEIIAVGRLDKQKNYKMLLNSFAEVVKKYPDYRLHILGKGPQESELKAMACDLGIEKQVTFEGFVKDVWSYIEKGQLYVLSSDYEGMPNSLIEAMALGMPCIATDCPCGGPSYLIKNGVNGILIPVRDTVALTEACERIINNEDEAKKMGLRAREITERLAPDVIYSQWESLIVELAAKGK